MIDPITKAVRDALPAPLLSQAQCHRVAVAVLRAVREPSDEALDAADEPFWAAMNQSRDISKKFGQPVGYASGSFSPTMWSAMIDTLISELEKEPAE